jgi:hypothetical protein
MVGDIGNGRSEQSENVGTTRLQLAGKMANDRRESMR